MGSHILAFAFIYATITSAPVLYCPEAVGLDLVIRRSPCALL